MFSKILKVYLILFISLFIGYSYINTLFAKEFEMTLVDKSVVNYLIPSVVATLLTFFLYRSIIKQLTINQRELNLLIWIVIPQSVAIPIGVSQGYFREMNSRVIEITTPEEIMLYPNENFFTIQKRYIYNTTFFL